MVGRLLANDLVEEGIAVVMIHVSQSHTLTFTLHPH